MATTPEDLAALRDRPRRLLAVFSHPDDEAYGVAGTLLRASRDADTAVALLCLTSGEASSVMRDQGHDRDAIRTLRESRMREVADVLALDGLLLPRLPDGGLAHLPFDELSAPVRAAVAAFEPQVVVVQDARGINGHADHIATHWAVRDALRHRPDVRLALVVYPPEVTEATDRLLFPTPREQMDALVELSPAEIDAKQRCLDIHDAPLRIRREPGTEDGWRPPVEHYDLFGELHDPPLTWLFDALPSRS
jgi:LmbE family N-acetylglucosaminyl deacetylase